MSSNLSIDSSFNPRFWRAVLNHKRGVSRLIMKKKKPSLQNTYEQSNLQITWASLLASVSKSTLYVTRIAIKTAQRVKKQQGSNLNRATEKVNRSIRRETTLPFAAMAVVTSFMVTDPTPPETMRIILRFGFEETPPSSCASWYGDCCCDSSSRASSRLSTTVLSATSADRRQIKAVMLLEQQERWLRARINIEA